MKFTPQQLGAFEAFSEEVERLEHACATLKQMLDQAWQHQHLFARVFELPRVQSDHGPPEEFIQPTGQDGRTGYRLAREALTDWYAVPGLATKAVHRTPGVIGVYAQNPTYAETLAQQVATVNRIKAQLRHHSKAMGDPEKRHELIHRRFYMMMLAQLTRSITLVHCPPDLASITFSWGFKTEIRRIDVTQACKMLEQMQPLNATMAMDSERTWSERVADEQARLQSLPDDTPLRWRRPLPARPLANLRWRFSNEELERRRKARARGEKVESPTFMREAHTPIIVINPPSGFRVGELGVFDLSEREHRQARKDRLCESEPVTPLAPIYQVSQSGPR